MSKFDTHGGYFAPKDYLRVNEGGSHEENPNGGVQIGVDPEGNPNLLEEGEPVYKDYVYSDNIEAEEQFLVDNNLPKKYTGKLYSKIADDLFSEAEERSLDPISRNGLEALLGRLADAQEGQKQAKEQRDLEDELASLSPEELEQLEGMLAQSEQGQMVPEQMPMGAVPEEQVVSSAEPMPVEGVPMMTNGGFLRMFDNGGSTNDELAKAMQKRAESRAMDFELKDARGDYNRYKLLNFFNAFGYKPYEKYVQSQLDELESMKNAYIAGERINGGIGEEDAILRKQKKVERIQDKLSEKADKIRETEKLKNDAEKRMNAIRFPFAQSFVPVEGYIQMPDSISPYMESQDNQYDYDDAYEDYENTYPDSVRVKPVQTPVVTTKPKTNENDFSVSEIDFGPFLKYGGEINRFDEGGFERLMNALRRYDRSTKRGGIAGTYAIDRRFPLGTEFKTIEDLENSEAYRKFTDYVVDHYQDPEVQAYLRLLDDRTHSGVQKLFDGDTLRSDWEQLYRRRRGDHLGGIYHFSTNVDDLARPVAPVQAQQPVASLPHVTGPLFDFATGTAYSPEGANLGMPDFKLHVPQSALEADTRFRIGRGDTRPFNEVYENTLVDFGGNPANTDNEVAGDMVDERNVNLLPTWPRYAGAIGSGLLGLYNVFQQPDRYTAPHINPQLPEGRINLQNQVYNPVDQNMVANAQIAQGNATNRALRNSGLGPSSAAAILAADNNTTGNLGTGFLQTWDANNQRRNAVIAANNQAEAQRAQFDYTVDAARKDAINRLAPYNAQNDLMVQRLNNQAEGEKYQAISNQISNGLQALSGIGQENFAMNQINTNPYYLGYRTAPNGAIGYYPWYGCNGGFLKKYKK